MLENAIMRLATDQLVDTVEVTLSQSFDKEYPTRHDFQDNIKSQYREYITKDIPEDYHKIKKQETKVLMEEKVNHFTGRAHIMLLVQ